MNKNKLILILIVVVALALRLFQANNYPPLLWDEASLGYNAYSIIKTGRDEYGQLLPLIFKSFGDYKPGLYIYSAIPFIATFGLTTQATRLPSIIAGSLMPLFFYFLIMAIDPKQKPVAIIAAILLTFNPYNIHFSKGAWESNLMLFEIVVASWLFFISLPAKRPQKAFFLLSALLFSATLYTYQSAKLVTPFIIIGLFLSNRQYLFTHRKVLFKTFIIPLFILGLPLIVGLISRQDGNRLQVISLFSYPRDPQETQQIIGESSLLDYQTFHNHALFFSRNFLQRYLNHFSPRFLLFAGDWQNPRHSAPYIGVILYPVLLFLLIGLFTANYHRKASLFFVLWLLLAPIPAALTRDTIQAVRSLPMSIPLMYFSAQGLLFFIQKINTFKLKLVLQSACFLAFFLSFVYYTDLYYNHMVEKSPSDFLYGYQQVVDYQKSHQNYDHIFFTDFYGQPYIFYLFYAQYDPALYQSQARLITHSVDTGTVEKIENITFGSVYLSGQGQQPNSLLIMSQDEIFRQGLLKNQQFMSRAIPMGQINNQNTFYLYETQ